MCFFHGVIKNIKILQTGLKDCFIRFFCRILTTIISCVQLWLPKAHVYLGMCKWTHVGSALLCSFDCCTISVLSNNSSSCVKMQLWDGPALKYRHTFFQKSLVSGIGVDDALSFVTSLGASQPAACCWAAGSGGFVFCLVVCSSWGEGTFFSDFTETTGCCSVLCKETGTCRLLETCEGQDTCSTFRYHLVQKPKLHSEPWLQRIHKTTRRCLPVLLNEVGSWKEESDYLVTHLS